ncbi:MAG TPA: META domain-containing protein [Anaerolineae bacterium]|nr:META domain-containing protein [Anaerolineae bacterium]
MRFSRVLLVAIVLTISACGPTGAATTPTLMPTQPPSNPQPPGDTNSLANTHWMLESFGALGAETPVVEGSSVTLEFGADGQAGGSGGCNSYGGPYQVQGDTLTFGEITSTLRACEDESIMQQEAEYFEALRSASTFELTGGNLTIFYGDGQALNCISS